MKIICHLSIVKQIGSLIYLILRLTFKYFIELSTTQNYIKL